MSESDARAREALERYVPLRGDARPEWEDVLRRAGVERAGDRAAVAEPERGRRVGRLAFAAALLAVAATVVSPLGPALGGLGRDAFDGLSAWLRGAPGEPAPAGEQGGFAARNAASYAAFPRGTRLRLVLRRSVGGKTFSLLGFRHESSLCLRLVRADRPSGRGANQCVSLRELRRSPAPALVASEAWFRFGDPETTVSGVFGFADDTTERVELRRACSGWTATPVVSNVFVALRARPSGTVANHPPFDPIVQVRAVTRDGRRVPLPFVADDSGNYRGGLPRGPSYLRHERVRPEDLPGPARAEVTFPGGTIGWLERREPRGEPFAPDVRPLGRLGQLVFARAVRPDPASPFRVGIALFRATERSRPGLARPGELIVCDSPIEPLGRAGGSSCGRPGPTGLFAPGRPITTGYMGPLQITRLSGLAADAVGRIELFLASGRVIPAALRHNAYAVEAPTAQFPAKLVAYDQRGRVLSVQVLGGSPKPAPCPVPEFPRPVSALAPPRPYERIDLASGHVAGSPVFGRSPAEIRAALGRPDRVAHFSSTDRGREPTFFYGGTTQSGAALLVRFGYRQQRLRAISLWYSSPSLVDARLGHVLRMRPTELQRRIAGTYRRTYRLDVGYGSQPSLGCAGSFRSRSRPVEVSFGLDPQRPSRPFLVLWHGY